MPGSGATYHMAEPALELPEQSASVEAEAGDAAVSLPPDRSGWTPHPSERRDFCNRIRAFPPDVAAWRKHLLQRIREEPGRFKGAYSTSPQEIQTRLDEGISTLREIARILAVLYGTPDLGNKQ